MRKRKLVLGLFGMFVTAGLLSGFVEAANVAPEPHLENVYYKHLGSCAWYGEDYETNSLSLLGGGWAYASADLHTCTPCYWYNAKNSGGVFGDADLIEVIPMNGLCSVETETYFDVMGAKMKVIASVGVPAGSI